MEAVFLDSDSSEGDFNPNCERDEICIEAEPDSIEASATSRKKTDKKRVSSKKRALTKVERKRLSERLHEADLPLLWHQITCKLSESTVSESSSQSNSKSKEASSSEDWHASHDCKLVVEVLSASTANTLNSIVIHLRDTFVHVYSKCEGRQTKEKYSAFQLEWHKHCSAFLLDKSLSMDTIGLPESDNKDLAGRRVEWIQFCERTGVNQEARNRIMMEICAAVYNFLLQRVSQFIKEEIVGEQSATDTTASADSDDVLYRFCSAALASMLQSRYKLIRTCPLERKDAISQEISLLQSINSKGKSHIPNYLQYRDRGFMYFPSEQFLPFLQAVDRNVRQYTNSDCFQRHGSQLVEVCTHTPMYMCVRACSALMCVCVYMYTHVDVMCVLTLCMCHRVCVLLNFFVNVCILY